MFYHSNWPWSQDPFYLHASADCSARIADYGITRVPFLLLDGVLEPWFMYTYQRIQTAFDERKALPAAVELSVGGSFVPTTGRLRLEVQVSAEANLPAGDYRLYAQLTESGLFFAGENGIDEHENTLRRMLTGPSGQALTFDGDLNASAELETELDPLYAPANCEVVVFLQEASTLEVQQATRIALPDLPEPTATAASSWGRIKSLY